MNSFDRTFRPCTRMRRVFAQHCPESRIGRGGNRNIREREDGGGKRKRERKYIVILIKSALERSRGLSRCTLSHESSHDNDTKCRPRDLGPPRDGGALITILRARRATSARCYTSRCPRPAPSGSLLPRALSLPVRATVFSPSLPPSRSSRGFDFN